MSHLSLGFWIAQRRGWCKTADVVVECTYNCELLCQLLLDKDFDGLCRSTTSVASTLKSLVRIEAFLYLTIDAGVQDPVAYSVGPRFVKIICAYHLSPRLPLQGGHLLRSAS